MLVHEKELLGFYLHEPPYAKHLKEIYQYVDIRLSQLDDNHVGKRATLGGVITDFKQILTKKNASEMAFIKVFDGSAEIDTVIFPKIFAEKKDILDKEVVVIMVGKIERREDVFSFIVDDINIFDPNASQLNAKYLLSGSNKVATEALPTKTVEIEIPQESASSDILQKINSALRQYPGNATISLLIPTKGSYRKLSLNFTVEPNNQLIASIEQILGSGRVRII